MMMFVCYLDLVVKACFWNIALTTHNQMVKINCLTTSQDSIACKVMAAELVEIYCAVQHKNSYRLLERGMK
jgi:hypothetical protein